MPENTRGQQKIPYSVRQGSELVGRGFHGYETDNDDPANMRPGAFRTITNARLRNGAIFPRGGMSKVNTSAFGSGVVGLHLTGDGSITQCAGGSGEGECGKADSVALVWTHMDIGAPGLARNYVLYYLDGSGDFCAIVNPDQDANAIVGRPYWGSSDGLGPVLYAPGSGSGTGAKEMRVAKMSRGPYPLHTGGTLHTFILDTLFRIADPYAGSPASGFYSMASLAGAPNMGGDGIGETFFLGWGKRDATAAAASDFHVYRYEAPGEGSPYAPAFTGELLFDTTSPGLPQVFSPGNGEIIAILNATEQDGVANQTHVGRAKVRSAAGVWANIATLDVSSIDGLTWTVPGSLRNVIAFDSTVFGGKFWIAVTANIFNGGGARVGGKHGFLFSYNLATGAYVAEHVVYPPGEPNESNSMSNVVTLQAHNGTLWYAWNYWNADLGQQRAFVGSYDGSTWNDELVELTTQFPGVDEVETVRHIIFAAGKWWAVVNGNGGVVGRGAVASTDDPTLASGWTYVTPITEANANKTPAFVNATETPIEEAIPGITVL